MINALNGLLVFVSPNSAVVLCGGIEFSILISAQTASKLSSLSSSERSNVRILTYLQHSEDSMVLYGFLEEEERRLFLELVKVNGISYRQALKILSGVRIKDFIDALDKGNVNFLSKIPGLGTKTSQKLILALRDKLVYLSDNVISSSDSSSVKTSLYQDIYNALVEMGYDRKKVSEVISDIIKENEQKFSKLENSDVEELIFKMAIVRLS